MPALKKEHGLSGGQAGAIFGIAILTFTITMIFAGRIQQTRGPRPVAATGALLFGAGYLLAGLSDGSFPALLASLGLLVGTGTGFGYVCPLATCVRWFPKHKGLVTGVAVAGFGGGAILLSGIAGRFLAENVPVLEIFRWVGVWYGLAALAGALALRFPEPAHSSSEPLIPLRALLGIREFRGLAAGMFAGTFGGLLIVGNLGPIGLAKDLTDAQAVLGIQLRALGNAAGRISWGWLYDRIGRPVLPISLVALLISISSLGLSSSAAAFHAMAVLTGFCFGACFVLYAAETASIFGHQRLGSTYPFIFLAYGLSGLIGPALGGWINDQTGSFKPAIMVTALIILVGTAIVWHTKPAGETSASLLKLKIEEA